MQISNSIFSSISMFSTAAGSFVTQAYNNSTNLNSTLDLKNITDTAINPGSLLTTRNWAMNDFPGSGFLTAHYTSKGARTYIGIIDTGYYENDDNIDYSKIIVNQNLDQLGCSSTSRYGISAHGHEVLGLIQAAAPEAKIIPINIRDCNTEKALDKREEDYNTDSYESAQLYRSSLKDIINTAIEDHEDSSEPLSLIINMSNQVTGEECHPLLQNYIDAITEQLLVNLFAAAGNDETSNVGFPANCNQVMSIGASNRTGQGSYFSNYGAAVDLYAPGESLRTTNAENRLRLVDGTSFATPLVSAAAALIQSDRSQKGHQLLDQESLMAIVKSTGHNFQSCSRVKSECSKSILNIADALEALKKDDSNQDKDVKSVSTSSRSTSVTSPTRSSSTTTSVTAPTATSTDADDTSSNAAAGSGISYQILLTSLLLSRIRLI